MNPESTHRFTRFATAAALALAVAAGAGAAACAQDHAGHDHKAGEPKDGAHKGHGHEGARAVLGVAEFSGDKVTATQIGKVEAGKESVFEVTLPKDAKAPKAVRMWIGVASGEGSAKAKANNDGDGFEAHVETPKTLAAGAKLWVEVEPAKGPKAKAGFDFKK